MRSARSSNSPSRIAAPLWIVLVFAGCASSAPTPPRPSEAATLNARAMAFHERRCLKDASALYQKVLARDPPADPTPEQSAAARKFLPRFFTTPNEFFPLNDLVVVVHPDKPIIAYHLFWDDDIDFPEDNDPCDHEIVWIEYDPARLQVTQVHTYFHGRILRTDQAAADANAHGGRAWIGVEWGKHGSLPWDAAGVKSGASEPLLKSHWDKLHNRGSRLPDHPLARDWPRKFPGDFDAYRDFAVPVDAAPLLEKKRLIKVSRWANAVLNQHCLRYNFAAKRDWPWVPE